MNDSKVDTVDYSAMSFGYDILLEIDGSIKYNKSAIMHLANHIGSLRDSWTIAKIYKRAFEEEFDKGDNIFGVKYAGDAHADYIRTLLKDDNSIEVLKHAKNYLIYLSSPDQKERERALIRALNDYEIFLQYMTKEDFVLMLSNISSILTLGKAEYMSEIQYIKYQLQISENRHS